MSEKNPFLSDEDIDNAFAGYSDSAFVARRVRTIMALFRAVKPVITKDGNQYCCLYGSNLQEGIAGFGVSPYEAVMDFNHVFTTGGKK